MLLEHLQALASQDAVMHNRPVKWAQLTGYAIGGTDLALQDFRRHCYSRAARPFGSVLAGWLVWYQAAVSQENTPLILKMKTTKPAKTVTNGYKCAEPSELCDSLSTE